MWTLSGIREKVGDIVYAHEARSCIEQGKRNRRQIPTTSCNSNELYVMMVCLLGLVCECPDVYRVMRITLCDAAFWRLIYF